MRTLYNIIRFEAVLSRFKAFKTPLGIIVSIKGK